MAGRVGELAVHVRAPAARHVTVRSDAEAFAVRVLRACEARLDARTPGRVVLVRRLDVALRLREGALQDVAEVDACAAALVDELEERCARSGADPPAPDAEMATFADEAAWRAAHWLAVAEERGDAWWSAPLAAEGALPGALATPAQRPLALQVLRRLLERGALARALAATPGHALRALAEAVDAAPNDGPAGTPTGVPPALAAALRGTRDALPPETTAAEGVCILAIAARATLGGHAAHDEVVGAAHAAWRADGSRPYKNTSDTYSDSDDGAELSSAFGGLVYLLAPALELDVGELLWRLCLPEGDVLARALAALLDEEGAGDPAVHLLAGGRPTAPVSVSADQHAEFAPALLGALAAALPRRGLVSLEAPVLRVSGAGESRLLVATLGARAFPVFAWPAPSAEAIAAGMAAFLAAWPAAAPRAKAPPMLAELASDTRVRTDAEAGPASVLPPTPVQDPAASAVVAQLWGTLVQLVAARAGDPATDDAAAFVARHLRVPATVTRGAETLSVSMPMERIDLALRRVGADRDPGWVPWLATRVTITFADGVAG